MLKRKVANSAMVEFDRQFIERLDKMAEKYGNKGE